MFLLVQFTRSVRLLFAFASTDNFSLNREERKTMCSNERGLWIDTFDSVLNVRADGLIFYSRKIALFVCMQDWKRDRMRVRNEEKYTKLENRCAYMSGAGEQEVKSFLHFFRKIIYTFMKRAKTHSEYNVREKWKVFDYSPRQCFISSFKHCGGYFDKFHLNWYPDAFARITSTFLINHITLSQCY